MTKLSEYKKAEKNVKEIVNDYEQMKQKYFNVLTENSTQKQQIQDMIQSKLEIDQAQKDLTEEKGKYIDELYTLRMKIKTHIDENSKKSGQLAHLSEELTSAHRKISELLKRDKEIAVIQNDVEFYAGFFGSIDKHMKTLVKLLREIISKCDDPRVIEHNQKQIKSIEGLLEEMRVVPQGSGIMQAAAPEKQLNESIFQISNDSLREGMNNETNTSIVAAEVKVQTNAAAVLGKRKREEEEEVVIEVIAKSPVKRVKDAANF